MIGDSGLFNGIELHFPYELELDSFDIIRKTAADFGLKIVSVIPGFINDDDFKKGAISSDDKKIRVKAILRLKQCLEFNRLLEKAGEGGFFTIFWVASEGFYYPFEDNYVLKRGLIVDALVDALDSVPGSKIALENQSSFPFCKNYFGSVAEIMLLCMKIGVMPGYVGRAGMNIDFAHVFMDNSFLAYDLSLALENGLLMHTHCNTAYRGGFDSDLLAGKVNYYETMEALYWLKKYDYKGWFGFDVSEQPDLEGLKSSVKTLQKMQREMGKFSKGADI